MPEKASRILEAEDTLDALDSSVIADSFSY